MFPGLFRTIRTLSGLGRFSKCPMIYQELLAHVVLDDLPNDVRFLHSPILQFIPSDSASSAFRDTSEVKAPRLNTKTVGPRIEASNQ